MEGKDLLQAALDRGWITPDQVEEALRAQEVMHSQAGVDLPIGDLLVRKAILTQEQLGELQAKPKGYAFGPYLVEGKIGEGGMGAVYLARKSGEEKPIALKILPQRFSEEGAYVQRFEREAKISIQLSHPNLVKGYEFGQVNGRWYYAMELIQGTVVSSLIRARKQLDERPALQIAIQIGRALEVIQKHGLVHRDVKPENVIVGEDGTAKLMDLGLAKSVGRDQTRLTQTGAAVGTPHYMSPEQVQGKDADIRSDVYSLGATLYHMVTGEQPFRGTTMLEIMTHQMKNELEDPRTLRPDLSEGICRVIERAMAWAVKDRYPTPAAMISDMSLVLEGKEPQTGVMEAGRSVVRRGPRSSRSTIRMRASRRGSNAGVWIGLGVGGAALLLILAFAGGGGGRRPGPTPGPRPGPALEPEESLLEKKIKEAQRALDSKEWDAALKAAEEALAAGPGDARARTIQTLAAQEKGFASALSRAQQHSRTGDLAAALSAAAEALSIKPGDSQAGALKTELEKRQREASYARAMASAEAAILVKDWNQAIELCRAALELKAGDAKAQEQLARIGRSRHAQAMARAEASFQAREWDKAVSAADEALSILPSDPAAADLKKKISEAKEQEEFERLVGAAEAALQVRDWVQAAESARKALERRPADARPKALLEKIDEERYQDAMDRARKYLDQGEWGRSIAAADEALAIRPADAAAEGIKKKIDAIGVEARFNQALKRAEHLLRLRKWEEARPDVEEALRLKATDRRALAAKEKYDNGIFREAKEMGDKHAADRKWDLAQEAYLKALKIKPTDRGAIAALEKVREQMGGAIGEWEELAVLSGHTAMVAGAALNHDGTLVATAGMDKTVRIWSASGGAAQQVLQGHTAPVYTVAFSRDGKTLASAGADYKVLLWDTSTWKTIRTLAEHASTIQGLAFSPDGRRLASASMDKSVKIWDLTSDKSLRTLSGHEGSIQKVAFSPDSQRLASAGADKLIKVWKVESGEKLFELQGHADLVYGVAYSPNGARIATVSRDKKLIFWDAAKGTKLQEHDTKAAPFAVLYSADGKFVATAEQDGSVHFYDPGTGAEARALTGHAAGAFCVGQSGDGKRLVSGGYDLKARVWGPGGGKVQAPDAPIEGEEMKVLFKTVGEATPQPMAANRWSKGSHLWWRGATIGSILRLQFTSEAEGERTVVLMYTKARDYGIHKVTINGKVLEEKLDLYDEQVIPGGEVEYARVPLRRGLNELHVQVVGSNPKAIAGYMFGLDYMKIKPR
jgi:WD40 repeat protein